MSEFSLVHAEGVPKRLEALYGERGTRKLLQAMAVTIDESTTPLFDELKKRAIEGDPTVVLPDRYSLYFSDDAWRYSLDRERRRRARQNRTALQDRLATIDALGIPESDGSRRSMARIIHAPLPGLRRFVPIAGRNHIKMYGAGDTVLSFGGVNCTAASFRNYDYLLETTDTHVANIIFDIAHRLYYHDRLSGLRKERAGERHRIDEHTVVLVDYGVPNQSIIYDAACRLVESADAGVLFVSQHRPGGSMEYALARQLEELGTDMIQSVFNHHSAFRGSGRLQQYVESLTPFLDEVHPEEGYIHAKFIIAYFRDGSRKAITGSHNFHEGGIRLGTAEIALSTSDDKLIDQLEQFAETLPLSQSTLPHVGR